MFLENVTERIQIEMSGSTKRYMVSAKQGDKATRYIEVTLLNNGKEYLIPEGSLVTSYVRKPDGKRVYASCEFGDAKVIVSLNSQTLAAAGTALCEVEVRTSDMTQVITSVTFEIEIEPRVKDENAILSSDEMSIFEEKMNKYEEAEKGREQEEQKRVEAEDDRIKNEENRKKDFEDIQKEIEKIQEKADNGDFTGTIEIGTVTTGEAGSKASVSNSGTSKAVILNMVIPEGEQGEKGEKGDKGEKGADGGFIPAGTIRYEELPSESKVGFLYNISDDFVTDDRFTEGAGKSYAAGSCVYWTVDGKWAVLVGAKYGQFVNDFIGTQAELQEAIAAGTTYEGMTVFVDDENEDNENEGSAGGGTGNLSDYYSLRGGTEITEGADLNDEAYKKIGNYYCKLISIASTLLNCPVQRAFTMKVMYGTGENYKQQLIKEYDTGNIWMRTFASNETDIAMEWTRISGNLSKMDALPSTYIMLRDGTPIPENADLNNSIYFKNGNYYCNQNSVAETLLNCPINRAFKMIVDRASGTDFPRQILIPYGNEGIYMRTDMGNTISGWVKFITEDDLKSQYGKVESDLEGVRLQYGYTGNVVCISGYITTDGLTALSNGQVLFTLPKPAVHEIYAEGIFYYGDTANPKLLNLFVQRNRDTCLSSGPVSLSGNNSCYCINFSYIAV